MKTIYAGISNPPRVPNKLMPCVAMKMNTRELGCHSLDDFMDLIK